ncbi:hypothetical protein D3Z55_08145 [Clostridiaceae bacterium]|nr:hypothetical protein [Clostridiaceae bacterium]
MYWPGRFHDGSVSGDFDFVTVFLKKNICSEKGIFTGKSDRCWAGFTSFWDNRFEKRLFL